MKRLLLLGLAALLSVSASGCLFGKKKASAKPKTEIAADTADIFRQRWLERRAGELTKGGLDASVAQTQAETEFAEKYAYLQGEKK